MKTALSPLEVARAAWTDGLPDWVETLAIECGRRSQAAVARDLDRSSAVISQVIRNIYPAETDRIEERVRGVFLNATIDCPALGILPQQECQDWRAKASEFALGNSHRARMFRACNECPRNARKEAKE